VLLIEVGVIAGVALLRFLSEARADQLMAQGWAVELDRLGGLLLTVEGARELLALVDPAALRAIAERIEGRA
jgi:hypothetical protein